MHIVNLFVWPCANQVASFFAFDMKECLENAFDMILKKAIKAVAQRSSLLAN